MTVFINLAQPIKMRKLHWNKTSVILLIDLNMNIKMYKKQFERYLQYFLQRNLIQIISPAIAQT